MLKFGKKKKDVAPQGQDADAAAAPEAGAEGDEAAAAKARDAFASPVIVAA